MDSLGLGTIISLYVSAKAAGCDLKLINLGKRIYELFRMTLVPSSTPSRRAGAISIPWPEVAVP